MSAPPVIIRYTIARYDDAPPPGADADAAVADAFASASERSSPLGRLWLVAANSADAKKSC